MGFVESMAASSCQCTAIRGSAFAAPKGASFSWGLTLQRRKPTLIRCEQSVGDSGRVLGHGALKPEPASSLIGASPEEVIRVGAKTRIRKGDDLVEELSQRPEIADVIANSSDGASLESPMEKEAWALLREAVVTYCGQPVGTIAANDPTDPFPLNYDQVFIRDFIPSAIAFLLKGEYDIVRNFIHHTLQLQVLVSRHSLNLNPHIHLLSIRVEFEFYFSKQISWTAEETILFIFCRLG